MKNWKVFNNYAINIRNKFLKRFNEYIFGEEILKSYCNSTFLWSNKEYPIYLGQIIERVQKKHQFIHLFNFMRKELNVLDWFLFLIIIQFKNENHKQLFGWFTGFSKRVKIMSVQSGYHLITHRNSKNLNKTMWVDIVNLENKIPGENFSDMIYLGKVIDIKMPVYDFEMEAEIAKFRKLADERIVLIKENHKKK